MMDRACLIFYFFIFITSHVFGQTEEEKDEIIKTLEKKISNKHIRAVIEFKANIDSQPNQAIQSPDLSSLSNAALLLAIWQNMEQLRKPY